METIVLSIEQELLKRILIDSIGKRTGHDVNVQAWDAALKHGLDMVEQDGFEDINGKGYVFNEAMSSFYEGYLAGQADGKASD